MLGVGMIIVAPVVEEITFRALLFRGLRQRWPLPPAAFLSGFVFAAFHLSATTLVPLTLTGIAIAKLAPWLGLEGVFDAVFVVLVVLQAMGLVALLRRMPAVRRR